MESHRNIITASMTRYKGRILPYLLVKGLGMLNSHGELPHSSLLLTVVAAKIARNLD